MRPKHRYWTRCAYRFNPRTCTRCDSSFAPSAIFLIVSIHAPVRDATLTSKDFRSFFVFQSTHLYEMRPLQAIPKTPMPKFQSTHLYEMRLYSTGLNMNRQCFNPRTCTRCDFHVDNSFGNLISFNPRTCTRCDVIKEPANPNDLFQSTHLYEMRLYIDKKEVTKVSIHAPVRDATPYI